MSTSVGLPEALERAATALPGDADGIRPANGDPAALLRALDAEAAARVLGWLLANEPEAGAELADTWAEDPDAASGPLPRLQAGALPKVGRKALSRARHRLRSRGIEIPEAQPAAVVAKLPPIEEELRAAFVSAVDPRGTRLAYLVESNPAGGVRLFELVLDEERGIVEFEVYATGRSKARQFLRDLRARERFPAVEAPADAVRALVKKIAEGQPTARPLPRGFIEFRSHVAEPAAGAHTPGALAREALGDGADAAALARAAEMVQRHEIGPWPTGAPVLEKVAERIAELGKSQLVISPAARREQGQSLLAEAQAEIFAEPVGGYTAQRFEESAYVLWKTGREPDAKACLAAAQAFRSGEAGENPVARALLEAVLAPVLASLDEPAAREAEPSLLVKP
ncbi:MAG: hypothetical protein ACHQ3O_07430 [Candidatus Limnocylindria bacterium]|jgi:hypothetical protein